MNVTIRHLRAAVAVGAHASFRRAAEAVHVSQPALSLAISELERELGVTLFDRTSRQVSTTELGASFLQGAVRVLGDFDRLVQEVGDVAKSRRGRVMVTCVSSVAGRVMPLAIRRCAQRYPEVEVSMQDDVAAGILASVQAGAVDLGVTVEPAAPGHGMVFEPLKQDRFHFVCDRRHPLAAKQRVAWADLNGQHLIALSTSSGMARIVQDELTRNHVVLARSTAVSHLATVHGMLEAGFGIGVLPTIALPVADHPTLTSRPLVRPALSRTIGIYRRKDRALAPAAAAFVEMLREVLKETA
ncbi:LysR family transcriptional regulator [Variovorax sp. KK3]|uniref:LysR family transcriptional regulator n=1 Tax=Variovorax sp. KK3 TaxID=1855728 RepID=UPI00097C5680|nr:LysR family transcriptional regulator [Variovorax sp. KK3]